MPGTPASERPASDYGTSPLGDHGTAYVERGEIYDFVQANGITEFATIAGDRHSFWAGLAAKTLPPKPFTPVGIAFVTGSISAPGIVEALERGLPKEHPLRPLYVGQAPGDHAPQPILNLLIRQAVTLQKRGRFRIPTFRRTSRSLTWEGTATRWFTLRANSSILTSSASPGPSNRSDRPDGGALSYRVKSRTALRKNGEAPKLHVKILEGDPKFSI